MVDKTGRRPLFVTSSTLVTIFLILLGEQIIIRRHTSGTSTAMPVVLSIPFLDTEVARVTDSAFGGRGSLRSKAVQQYSSSTPSIARSGGFVYYL